MITVLIILLFILVLALVVNYSVDKSQPKDKSELIDPDHRQVVLNVNSWHFKYYEYVTGNKQPKSLCPYFWSLVYLIPLAVVIVPFILLFKMIFYFIESKELKEQKKLAGMSNEELHKYYQKKHDKEIRSEYISELCGKIFLILVGVLLLTGLIFCLIITTIDWSHLMKLLILIGVLITIFFIGWLLWKSVEGISKWVKNTLTYQIFVRGFKAWYDKSCPLIKWEGETTSITTENYIDENDNS